MQPIRHWAWRRRLRVGRRVTTGRAAGHGRGWFAYEVAAAPSRWRRDRLVSALAIRWTRQRAETAHATGRGTTADPGFPDRSPGGSRPAFNGPGDGTVYSYDADGRPATRLLGGKIVCCYDTAGRLITIDYGPRADEVTATACPAPPDPPPATAGEARRMAALELENTRLKMIVAEQSLQIAALEELRDGGL